MPVSGKSKLQIEIMHHSVGIPDKRDCSEPSMIIPSAVLGQEVSKAHGLTLESGVRQGCALAPDSFATVMDWLLERTIGSGATLVLFGQASFTDLDFADDVSLLELLQSGVGVNGRCGSVLGNRGELAEDKDSSFG